MTRSTFSLVAVLLLAAACGSDDASSAADAGDRSPPVPEGSTGAGRAFPVEAVPPDPAFISEDSLPPLPPPLHASYEDCMRAAAELTPPAVRAQVERGCRARRDAKPGG